MKKAGLLAIMLTSCTIVFSAPAVNANQMDGMANSNAAITPAPTSSTLTQDINKSYTNMKNGVTRTTERMGYDVNRATNRIGNDLNRMGTDVNRTTNRVENGVGNTIGVRDYDAYNTGTHRTNMLNNTNYRAKATATNGRGFSWGWLGMLGLLGLAGMRSRDRDRA